MDSVIDELALALVNMKRIRAIGCELPLMTTNEEIARQRASELQRVSVLCDVYIPNQKEDGSFWVKIMKKS